MITQSQDIAIVLSGGTSNSDPNHSLGGASSATPLVSGNLNNLFDDVTSDEGVSGSEEYRAIYIFNDGDTTIFDCEVWISAEQEDGATAELGIHSAAEVQRVRITGFPVTGSITLQYREVDFSVNFNPDPSVLATNLQTALNNLRDGQNNHLLRQVKVTAQLLSGVILLDVDFGGGFSGAGQDDLRNHDLIAHVSNTLNPTAEISVSVLQEGGPINETAEVVDTETQPPSNVGFFKPTSVSPITIPKLEPTDGFALWIKRVAPSNIVPVERDGFTFRFKADSLDPLGE